VINDAQVGDPPAMVNDAQILSDRPLTPEEVGAAPPMAEPVAEATAVPEPEPEAQAVVEPEPESAEEKAADAEAFDAGYEAAREGRPRATPDGVDGRTAAGKAWLRGYDSVADPGEEAAKV
jgi:hypothetical protein